MPLYHKLKVSLAYDVTQIKMIRLTNTTNVIMKSETWFKTTPMSFTFENDNMCVCPTLSDKLLLLFQNWRSTQYKFCFWIINIYFTFDHLRYDEAHHIPLHHIPLIVPSYITHQYDHLEKKYVSDPIIDRDITY